MALMFDSDEEDAAADPEVVNLSICRALTGVLIQEVTMRLSDTVLDLEQSLGKSVDLECLPRLLHNDAPLRAADTLAEAGLRSGDRVLAIVCPYQAVATTSHDHTACIWNAATGECQRTLEGHTNYVHCASFSPDGRFLATGSHDRTALVWRLATGQVHQRLEAHHSYVKAICYSPDGASLATGSGDCTAMIWDVEAGIPRSWEVTEVGDHKRRRYTLQGHMSSLNSISYSPDSRLVATGSEDRTAMVWDAETGLSTLTLKGHSSSTYASFSPCGRRIATASDDKSAKVWDATTGECLRTFDGHAKFIRSIAWSPDSRQIITASGDGTAKIWSVETGKCAQTLSGHSSFVYSAIFSPDGNTVLTGSADATACIWDAATGGCERVLKGHKKQVLSVAFRPDRSSQSKEEEATN
eukprot:CAMPEP_0204582724 /NCGR_PEP_ID=MMETSP0661-20131031/45374_1 /ASSEMBLY_ACC=CAM_ASM_000606 /TAXON_ID=109239 /ORGANISM="Alexandrium margalefi, Strain AMGDE01CS-322" /LENGTH=411 /DNA_ID=CAMNT_0051592023 /DNA_START=18 /DNA_END=1253 /DNA_ORIENTATION=-